MYTFDGRLVYHQTENQVGTALKLDMRNINAGTYLLELESEGKKIYKNILKL
ncbi:MAG: T9SS type A sorting domain-containing protein [Crocinitomicaceae bacterium]